MKYIILFGMLLALTVGCKNNMATPTLNEEDTKAKEVQRLLAEANALWMPSADSNFLYQGKTEHVSINDKEIQAKLDSALTLDPTNIKVYTGRISYLMACRKLKEALSTLREAEKHAPFNADLWSTKAMLEDYHGDSLTAQKNYRSADSAYARLIEEYATDSLRYPAFRMNRALNRAMMTDNFALLEQEVKFTKQIYPISWKSVDIDFYGKNKKEFFNKIFGKR